MPSLHGVLGIIFAVPGFYILEYQLVSVLLLKLRFCIAKSYHIKNQIKALCELINSVLSLCNLFPGKEISSNWVLIGYY